MYCMYIYILACECYQRTPFSPQNWDAPQAILDLGLPWSRHRAASVAAQARAWAWAKGAGMSRASVDAKNPQMAYKWLIIIIVYHSNLP